MSLVVTREEGVQQAVSVCRTVMVAFTWPYLLGSLARFLSSRSWLSLEMSQQESSAYLDRRETDTDTDSSPQNHTWVHPHVSLALA